MSLRILIALTVFTVLGITLSFLWVRGFSRLYDRVWTYPLVRKIVWSVPILWGLATVANFALRRLDGPAAAFKVLGGIRGTLAVIILSTLPFIAIGLLLRRWAQPRPPSTEARLADAIGVDRSGAVSSASTDVERNTEAAETAAHVSEASETEASSSSMAPEIDGEAAPVLARRRFLLHTAQAMPVAGLALAGKGTVGGMAPAQVVRLEMTFPNLPEALEGFTILHYTDMHLGTFIDLAEVQALTEAGKPHNPDLVVLTGDISDDLYRLPAALRMFESIEPKVGVVASIGNHEYFRGFKETLVSYAKTDVPILIEKGIEIEHEGARLYVAGADDPRFLRGDNLEFMHRTVNESLDGAPSEAFRLLLSHRPEGFVAAAKSGYDLTLSGHTHGAQLGFNGRSLLEGFMPDKFLWGAYSSGDARLYTSSGVGHWMPFRLGCPREIPMIVLRKGPSGGDVQKVRIA